LILNWSGKPPKITKAVGELHDHRLILARLKGALQTKEFNLITLFPTLSLLNTIQQELLNEPEVPGTGGIRFLLFEGFMDEIWQRLGLTRRLPSSLERNLLIAQSFRNLEATGELSYLCQAPFTASYRQAILQGFAEWKRSRLTPAFFTEWAVARGPKVRQLALLYQDYQTRLTRYGFAEDDLIPAELERRWDQAPIDRRALILLYGFTDLTRLQSDIISGLTAWFDVEIILDPTGVPFFQKLSAGCFDIPVGEDLGIGSGTEAASQPESSNSSCLTRLQERFWTGEPEILPLRAGDDSLELFQTAGLRRQVAAIGREIAMIYQSNPDYNRADILIFTPDPDRFVRAAVPVFKEYRIPLAGMSIAAVEFPGVNHILNTLTAVNNDWQWPDLATLIRYYYKEDPSTGDQLLIMIGERYGALSGRERWLKLIDSDNFRLYLSEIGLPTEPLFDGITRLARVPTRAPLIDYLKLIRDFLETMIAVEAGQVLRVEWDDASEAGQRRFQNLQVAQIIGRNVEELSTFSERVPEWRVEIGSAEFLAFFTEYILDIEIDSLIPGQTGVRVLPPREARGLRAPVVFITGLEQGIFPRTYINDWKLSPRDRFELKVSGIELETGDHYALQERLAFYWALRSATNQLYLVYQDQDEEGQPLNRSVFLDEIREWVPELAGRTVIHSLAPRLPELVTECLSASETRRRWARFLTQEPKDFSETERVQFQSLISFAANRRLAEQIGKCHQRRMGPAVPLFQNPESLQLIHQLFGPEYSFAITMLEDYRNCPYRFFLKHGLKTGPVFEPPLFPAALDLGSLLHQILEDFGATYRDGTLQPEQAVEYEGRLMESFYSHFQEWYDGAANDLVKLILSLQENQIRKILLRWLSNELEWAAETKQRFHIGHVEFGFGLVKGDYDPASRPHPYHLEADSPTGGIKIQGKVDRVDVDMGGNFVVYDYKSGLGPSFKNILNFDSLQIPVYIMALEQLIFGEGTAAGGSYLGLRQPSRSRGGVWRSSKINELGGAGVLEEAAWRDWLTRVRDTIRDNVEAIRRGVFNLPAEKCLPYCEYRDVCRPGEWEVQGPDGLPIESRAV
jgi:ATP-dependent helicase/DNAse subunit B